MKTIIIEDEAIAARRLSRMLEERHFEILKTIPSVALLKEQLSSSLQPDVYFFDIHLNDGIVFDALNEIKTEVPIIFTTAYDQYAIKAFKENSIDYLLKPIDAEELDQAIKKLNKSLNKGQDMSMLTNMLQQFQQQQKPQFRNRISIKVADKIKSFSLDEILFFYSESKMNFLFLKTGRSYPIEQSIESLSKELNPEKFYRVNRGYIVSINAISEIVAYSNSRLKVKVTEAANHEIIVSREKVKDFKTWLG